MRSGDASITKLIRSSRNLEKSWNDDHARDMGRLPSIVERNHRSWLERLSETSWDRPGKRIPLWTQLVWTVSTVFVVALRTADRDVTAGASAGAAGVTGATTGSAVLTVGVGVGSGASGGVTVATVVL